MNQNLALPSYILKYLCVGQLKGRLSFQQIQMIWKYYDDDDDQGDRDDNRPKGGCAVQGSHKVDIVSHSYLQNTSVLVDFMKKMGPFYEIQMWLSFFLFITLDLNQGFNIW